jgi:tetratricopeptide (TPR) repeat protein
MHIRMARFAVALLLLLNICPLAAADSNVDAFVGGLDAMAAGNFDQAANLLGTASAADPSDAIAKRDLGVAFLLLGKNDEAREAFTQAAGIDPQDSDLRVWSLARAMMFDAKAPTLELPSDYVPYSRTLMVAILGMKSANPDDRAKCRATIEQVARDFAGDQRRGMVAAKALYGAGRFRDALQILDSLRAKSPSDGVILGYSGHCKLGLGDYGGARKDYTLALLDLPQQAGCLIGRARCEIEQNCLDAAQSDLALARRINNPSAAGLLAQTERMLADAKSKTQSSGAEPMRQEQYTRELIRLQLDIRDNPNQPTPYLALVRFYLQPTAVCAVTLNGKTTHARVPCGAMNLHGAEAAIAPAVKLAPDDPQVLIQQARVYLAEQRLDDMIATADKALDQNVSDLELAAAYLHYENELANEHTQAANEIRNRPTRLIWVQQGTVWIQKAVGPNADDYARADDLDRRAKQLKAQATRALEVLQKVTANSSDPRDQFDSHMVDAYHDLWFGNLQGSIDSAEQALAIDPFSEHALRFLVTTCGKTNSPKAEMYRERLREVDDY